MRSISAKLSLRQIKLLRYDLLQPLPSFTFCKSLGFDDMLELIALGGFHFAKERAGLYAVCPLRLICYSCWIHVIFEDSLIFTLYYSSF